MNGGNSLNIFSICLSRSLIRFSALLGIVFLWHVGTWYRTNATSAGSAQRVASRPEGMSRRHIGAVMAILLTLIFSKYVYLASLSSYYTFYLISRFHLSVQSAQLHLFLFLAAVAAGTLIGGPIGDRFGRRRVILGSILGVLPFTLALPHANLFWTRILTAVIGLILASAFSAIVVYAQEIVPGRVGLIAGLFFGVAFGTAGIGAAVLGKLADHMGIFFVYQICAFLPALGILALSAYGRDVDALRARLRDLRTYHAGRIIVVRRWRVLGQQAIDILVKETRSTTAVEQIEEVQRQRANLRVRVVCP